MTGLTDRQRYHVSVPAGAFLKGAASSVAFHFEFEYDASGFNATSMALSAGAASTESELLYDLALPEVEAGAYSVCYCDDQKDKTLEDMGDGDTTYHLYDDNKCTGLPRVTESLVVAEKPLPEHQCEAKCSKGCVGPFCYCAGYDGTATVETLCQLPLGEVGAACVEVASNPLNATLAATGNPATEEAWQLFSKSPGTACTHLSDYTEVAGSLAVTTRVEVGVDYVLHPGKAGSVELTAPVALPEDGEGSLTFEHSPVYGFTARKLLSADRITIIDCKGTCGVSPPTTALELPEKAADIETWNHLAPNSWFVDLPHIDQPENPFSPKDSIEFAPSDPSRRYITREDFYCQGSNFDVTTTSVPFGGTSRT